MKRNTEITVRFPEKLDGYSMMFANYSTPTRRVLRRLNARQKLKDQRIDRYRIPRNTIQTAKSEHLLRILIDKESIKLKKKVALSDNPWNKETGKADKMYLKVFFR